MLEPILIQQTSDTPKVELDMEKGVFLFEGKSLPEDVFKFYTPVQQWFSEYVSQANNQTEIVFNLDYFNSSSARFIVKILIGLEPLCEEGKNVHVTWYYSQDDELMYDRGVELKSVLKLPFDVVLK